MEPLDSDAIVKRSDLDNNSILEASLNLQGGQTKYQNTAFVVGSQLTPFMKMKQALMELETRNHGYVELQYRIKLCKNKIKKIERSIEWEKDDLEIENLEIELEKAFYDLTIFEKKEIPFEQEIDDFCDIVRELKDPDTPLLDYLKVSEEEDRKYWITRMAKQSAVDMHTLGRIGSGNLDSILQMPPEDQLQAIQGAVEHATLLTAGVDKLTQQLLPEVRELLESNDFKVPQLKSFDRQTIPSLPEVNNDETNAPKEKFRLQSSNKSEA